MNFQAQLNELINKSYGAEAPEMYYWWGGTVVVIILLVVYWRKTRAKRNFLVFRDESGIAETTNAALKDLVKLACEHLDTASKPRIKFIKRHGRINIYIRAKLFEGQRIGNVRDHLRRRITHILQETHGILVGDISFTATGFKKEIPIDPPKDTKAKKASEAAEQEAVLEAEEANNALVLAKEQSALAQSQAKAIESAPEKAEEAEPADPEPKKSGLFSSKKTKPAEEPKPAPAAEPAPVEKPAPVETKPAAEPEKAPKPKDDAPAEPVGWIPVDESEKAEDAEAPKKKKKGLFGFGKKKSKESDATPTPPVPVEPSGPGQSSEPEKPAEAAPAADPVKPSEPAANAEATEEEKKKKSVEEELAEDPFDDFPMLPDDFDDGLEEKENLPDK
ncbi:MAG: hypothetical protein AAFX93_10250 [Verrucomicrobiota bacterium]